MYNSRVKNIEIPENLFSNLGEMKSKTVKKPTPSIQEEYSYIEENTEFMPKLTNFTHKKEYRDRISKMYEEIKDINPIDNEIDNIIYFSNYIEKGIVIKPKISSMKQFWTEYRLINNENMDKIDTINKKELINIVEDNKNSNNLEEFDKLFDVLSNRVSEINKYINELKEMRTNIDISSNKLEEEKEKLFEEKEKLSEEKEKFLSYKKEEESKIKKEKENLKINFARLQTIIDDLDQNLGSIEE